MSGFDPDSKRAWSYTKEGRLESSMVLATSDPWVTLALDQVFAALNNDVDG